MMVGHTRWAVDRRDALEPLLRDLGEVRTLDLGDATRAIARARISPGMPYRIAYDPTARRHPRALRANQRARVLDAIEEYLL